MTLEELIKKIKAYRNDMVARNYPYQEISDIITEWEKTHKDFKEEADKEKKELKECYEEAKRQTKERKNFHPKAIDGYSE